jgi:hypothetical protein
MFGAFKMYGDPVLDNLLHAFIHFLTMTDFAELFDDIKVRLAVMEVMRSITEFHVGLTLKVVPDFFDQMIEILRRGYADFDHETVQSAVEASKNLGDFCLLNKHKARVNEALSRNGEALMELFCAAVQYLCNYKNHIYPNFAFFRSMIHLSPPLLQAIFEMLRPQIADSFIPEFTAIFDEIARAAVSPDEAVLTKVLSSFRQFAAGKDLHLLN